MGMHISRALQIQARIGGFEARVAAAESALDALPVPVFLLGAQRELRYTNRAADQLIAAEPALRVVNGRFAPEGCVDDAQWRHAYARGGLLLRRTTGEPLPLALMPVPEQSRLMRERPGVATLMTAADLRSPSARAQRLRVFYGLSSAEADLAVLLCCDGLSPQECAGLRGVSIGTIRTQIKSIYAKTAVGGRRSLRRWSCRREGRVGVGARVSATACAENWGLTSSRATGAGAVRRSSCDRFAAAPT